MAEPTSAPTMIRFRRWASMKAHRVGWRWLGVRLHPGPRIRLWDSEFALLADTDRGDVILPSPGVIVTVEPAQRA